MHKKSDFYQIFFCIVYNKVVVISSKDSHIVHDYMIESKVYEKLDE